MNKLEKLNEIDTPTLSNAIELFRVRNNTEGFCNKDIKCLFPELDVMCGYAVTAKVETINSEIEGGLDSKFIELCQAIERNEKPAVVVLSETSEYPELSAHCGEVMATVFKRLGCVGIVTDSSVRDIEEVKALGLHYFACGAVASHGNFRIIDVEVKVNVDGLEINPGDILHGDLNGLIKIPDLPIDDLIEKVDTVRNNEKKILDLIESEDFDLSRLSDYISH